MWVKETTTFEFFQRYWISFQDDVASANESVLEWRCKGDSMRFIILHFHSLRFSTGDLFPHRKRSNKTPREDRCIPGDRLYFTIASNQK